MLGSSPSFGFGASSRSLPFTETNISVATATDR